MEAGLTFKDKIKAQNRVDVLNLLLKNGPSSRVDLAKDMKLTKAALTLITNLMIDEGILLEKGEMPPESEKYNRGRRKIILTLNEYHKLLLGVAVEKNSLSIGLSNLIGEVMDKQVIKLNDFSYRAVLEKIAEGVSEILKLNCLTQDRLLGIGITISRGAEDYIDGQTPSEKTLRLRRDVQKAFSAKIYAGRTIDGALFAERLFSKKEKLVSDALVLRYGEDISSSVMINGGVYQGASFNSGGFNLPDENEIALFKGTVASKDERLEQKLLEIVANQITECIKFIDIAEMYIFGSFFEEEGLVDRLNLITERISGGRVKATLAKVREKTLFLCGCAIAAERSLYRIEE